MAHELGARKVLRAWLLGGALLGLVVAPAAAKTWYVQAAASPSPAAEGAFPSIQQALAVAAAGDEIVVRRGVYSEQLRTVRDGRPDAPITLRAMDGPGTVVVTAPGRVFTVDHEWVSVAGLTFDGQFGSDDTLRVATRARGFTLRDAEVRRSSRDLIDIGGTADVTIAGCLFHRALNPVGGRSDAHGIVAGAVRNLTITDTEIHTFSGDGIQVDSGRAAPGWDNVVLERLRIWLAPLAVTENGFAAGVVPGENAVDTKASADHPRARIAIRDTTASGFRSGLIGNMAAFNLKEHVEVTVDRVTVLDSEIAFRLRGGRPGAWVTIANAVVHDVAVAFRYEDDIERLRISNTTLGTGVARPFVAAASSPRGLEVRNLLVVGRLPEEAAHSSNKAVDPAGFVDASRHDYRLAPASAAVDAGVPIAGLETDRAGQPRSAGKAVDVGAYEFSPPARRN